MLSYFILLDLSCLGGVFWKDNLTSFIVDSFSYNLDYVCLESCNFKKTTLWSYYISLFSGFNLGL